MRTVFLVANAIIVAITFGALAVADRTGAGERAVVKVVLAGLFFLGPFAASTGCCGRGADRAKARLHLQSYRACRKWMRLTTPG